MNLDQVRSWFEHNRWLVILALAGLIIFGSGLFWLKTSGQPQTQVEILSASTEQTNAKSIYIDVSGAVNKPGVYQLELGSRVEDALRAAGGFTEGASTKWIETNLNRAMILVDGAKIYIPSQSEIQTNSAGASSSLVKTISEKVNLNSASQSELETLTGVGPVTAVKIISGRPYQTIEELVSKKILGQKTFDKLKDQLAVW